MASLAATGQEQVSYTGLNRMLPGFRLRPPSTICPPWRRPSRRRFHLRRPLGAHPGRRRGQPGPADSTTLTGSPGSLPGPREAPADTAMRSRPAWAAPGNPIRPRAIRDRTRPDDPGQGPGQRPAHRGPAGHRRGGPGLCPGDPRGHLRRESSGYGDGPGGAFWAPWNRDSWSGVKRVGGHFRKRGCRRWRVNFPR